MNNKSFYKYFLVLFIALFFAVAAIAVLNIDTKSELSNENRFLAKPPEIDNFSKTYKDFPKNFENYFNDRFGYRWEAIITYRLAYYHLFNAFPVSNPVAGKSRHFYYKDIIEYSLNQFPTINVDEYSGFLSEMFAIAENNNLMINVYNAAHTPLFSFEYLPDYYQAKTTLKYLDNPLQLDVKNKLPERYRNHYIFPFYEYKELYKWSSVRGGDYHQIRKSPETALIASMVAYNFGIIDKIEIPTADEFNAECDKEYILAEIPKHYGIIINHYKYRNCSNKDYLESYGVSSGAFLVSNNKVKKGTLLVVGDSFVYPLLYDLAKYFNKVQGMVQDELLSTKSDETIWLINNTIRPDYILFANSKKTPDYREVLKKIMVKNVK